MINRYTHQSQSICKSYCAFIVIQHVPISIFKNHLYFVVSFQLHITVYHFYNYFSHFSHNSQLSYYLCIEFMLYVFSPNIHQIKCWDSIKVSLVSSKPKLKVYNHNIIMIALSNGKYLVCTFFFFVVKNFKFRFH